MKLSARQEQVLIALLSSNRTLPDLVAIPLLKDSSERTLQRDLGELIMTGFVSRRGKARASTYYVTPKGKLQTNLPEPTLEQIFANEARPSTTYDFARLETMASLPLFSEEDYHQLDEYHAAFFSKLKNASPDIIRRERERISIELAWKSSQLEGNTYTLLETESLIKNKTLGKGRSPEETNMILNHKKALDFTEQNRELFVQNLTPQTVIELHKILGQGLISHGLREGGVGITGSIYRPLENKYQLHEELNRLCGVINAKSSVFDKALLAFVFICYLQPFNDGNKRTGRILANGLLYAHDSFPLSLRAVSTNTYKMAMLAFYELGILGNAKQVMVNQAHFAAENYSI